MCRKRSPDSSPIEGLCDFGRWPAPPQGVQLAASVLEGQTVLVALAHAALTA
jgi:hypothetical protein